MGAEVAGAGAADDETVADKLADAGMFGVEAPGMAAAELLEEMPLDNLEVPGTAAPKDTEAVEPGVGTGLPLELDNSGVPPIEAEVLVPKDEI